MTIVSFFVDPLWGPTNAPDTTPEEFPKRGRKPAWEPEPGDPDAGSTILQSKRHPLPKYPW